MADVQHELIFNLIDFKRRCEINESELIKELKEYIHQYEDEQQECEQEEDEFFDMKLI